MKQGTLRVPLTWVPVTLIVCLLNCGRSLLASTPVSGGPPIDLTYSCGEFRIHIWAKNSEPSADQSTMVTIREQTGTKRARFFIEGRGDVVTCTPNGLGFGDPILAIQAWTGGAHCCETYSYWSLGTQPVNLLTYRRGNMYETDGIERHYLKDLDGDGIKEIISTDDAMQYFPACFACTGPIIVVFCKQGERYEDCTRKFPEAPIRYVSELKQTKDWRWESYDLYANFTSAGKETEILEWLELNVPPEPLSDFKADLPELRNRMSERPSKIHWIKEVAK